MPSVDASGPAPRCTTFFHENLRTQSGDSVTHTMSAPPSVVRIQWRRFLVILLQLGLFVVVLYLYDLESRAFLHVGIATFCGFAVHYFLPRTFRRPFFAALSLFCLATVFGFQLERWSSAGLAAAAWIVGLGLGIVGICHLPVPFRFRVAVLAAAGATLAVMRAGYVQVPWSGAIWPILGSMFMFRTVVYLHALKYDK